MGFGKSQRRMADRNAVVVGISSAEERKLRRLATYFRFLRIDLPLAHDSNSRVGGLYDLKSDAGEQNLRVTYVIDEDGLVRDFHHNELSAFSHWRWALRTVRDAGQATGPGAQDSSPPAQ